MVAPEVHNRSYAQLSQFAKPCLFGLCAAVKQVVDFTRVVNSGNAQFLPISRFGRHGIRRFPRSFFLRKELRRKKSQEGQADEISLHPHLHASSVTPGETPAKSVEAPQVAGKTDHYK